ncbi:unnamed protein product, partial [Rotaria sp. Silwood1]
YETLENNFDEFRRTAELEKSQIVKAFQSDFEFEIDKSSNEQDKNQILTTTIDIQTDEQLKFDKQTSIIFNTEHQLTQTNQIEFIDQSIQTSTDDYDETIRRLTTKEQQIQFNLAIQRAVQNATDGQKKINNNYVLGDVAAFPAANMLCAINVLGIEIGSLRLINVVRLLISSKLLFFSSLFNCCSSSFDVVITDFVIDGINDGGVDDNV